MMTPEVEERRETNNSSTHLIADISLGVRPEEGTNEVKDARLLFGMVWRDVMNKVGLENMVFPQQIVFVSGAPGAGKGTMIGYIKRERDIAQSVEMSSLLDSPSFKELKRRGALIGDREVLEALMMELIQPKNALGLVVDGFPRTLVQAESINLLRDRLLELSAEYRNHPTLRKVFRKPNIHICVLYCSEEESVHRQLKRGQEMLRLNKIVQDTGVGSITEARETDLSEEAARKRYRLFKEEVFASLQAIKGAFPFHFVSAEGSPTEVKAKILEELHYQSSQDLGEETFEAMRIIEPASSVVKQARTHLVTRLNSYATDYSDVFHQVLQMIQSEFLHIIKRQALAGHAIIRSNNPLLESPIVVNMILDILSERGFTVVLDVVRHTIPTFIEPALPGDVAGQKIISRVERTFVFTITFPKPEIRRNE